MRHRGVQVRPHAPFRQRCGLTRRSQPYRAAAGGGHDGRRGGPQLQYDGVPGGAAAAGPVSSPVSFPARRRSPRSRRRYSGWTLRRQSATWRWRAARWPPLSASTASPGAHQA